MAVTEPGCGLHGIPAGQACRICTSAATGDWTSFGPVLPVPVDVPTGWTCPHCKHVYSPSTSECFRCAPPPVLTAPFLPRLKEAFRVGPITPVPVDDLPPGFERAEPRRWEYPVGGPGCPGCVQPDHRSVLRVPEFMTHEGGYRIVKVDAGFTDVFPGLQVAAFLPSGDEGIIAHFRLTPPEDEHDHD